MRILLSTHSRFRLRNLFFITHSYLVACVVEKSEKMLRKKVVTLKVPITTVADHKFCDIFPNF